MDKAGHIIVDEYQNTNAKNIFALGDVCGKALLTPGKRYEGLTKYLRTSPSTSLFGFFLKFTKLLVFFYSKEIKISMLY